MIIFTYKKVKIDTCNQRDIITASILTITYNY